MSSPFVADFVRWTVPVQKGSLVAEGVLGARTGPLRRIARHGDVAEFKMPTLRTLIVDDEPLAIQRLRMALEDMAGVLVVGEARDGAAAVAAIRDCAPDLVLMDIRMPGLNGIEVAEALSAQAETHVVFVTAYTRFAPKAFEVAAVDYLVKPVEFERLRTAIDRVRERVETRAALRAASEQKAATQPVNGHYKRELWVKHRSRSVRVPVDQLRRLEAEADYVRLHAGPDSYLLRGSMTEMEKSLDPEAFVRVHRSHIVRVETVARIDRSEAGAAVLRLNTGEEVPISRRLKAAVRARLTSR